MKRSLRACAVAGVLLSACAGDDGARDAAQTTVGPTAAPSSTGASAATTPSPTSAASAPGTVTIETSFGKFDVPRDPSRVVVFEGRRDLETALVLGWDPIAVGENGLDASGEAAPFLDFDMAGRETISPSEPNIEAIADLRPDVIIGRQNNLEDFAPELGAVAPLVPIDTDLPWRESLEQVGTLLGRDDAVAAALADYDALRDDIAARHADAIGSASIAIVAYFADDAQFVTSTTDGFFLQPQTLDDLGGTYLPYLVESADEFGDVYISLENTGELAAADAILLIASDEDRAALEAEDLWTRLPAVEQGHVIVTDARTSQGSVFAAMESLRLLDSLYATLG